MKAIFATALIILCVVNGASALASISCTAPCTKSQCELSKCDLSAPYACVGGSASGGCAKVPSHFDNTSTCTSCCNVIGCTIKCDKCTAAECAANPCTTVDPFLCTAGADKNGCAPTNKSWSNNPGCSKCCDTSSCGGSNPNKTCSGSCGDLCKNPKRCPTSTPYMCTAGNATDGCSLTASGWDTPQCTACCDVNKCPKTPCGKCSKEVCKNTQCSATNPYICTGGILNGGCSASKSYWPASPDCTSCCDFDQC